MPTTFFSSSTCKMIFVPVARSPSPAAMRSSRPSIASRRNSSTSCLTQDWHPSNHFSFAASHPGKKPYDSIDLAYGPQTLWPPHCVQGTRGAEFHPSLQLTRAELILRKGFRPQIDSYSAFFENDRSTPTGLAGYLRERGLTRVFLAGLAYDYCVGYSALDARRLGLPAFVLRDACRAIDLNGSAAAMDAEFAKAGVTVINSAELSA